MKTHFKYYQYYYVKVSHFGNETLFIFTIKSNTLLLTESKYDISCIDK